MGEQLRRLRAEGIAITITPSHALFCRRRYLALDMNCLARSCPVSHSHPHTQCLVMPKGETWKTLQKLARPWLFIFRSQSVKYGCTIDPVYGAHCPVAVVFGTSRRTSKSSALILAGLNAICLRALNAALILVGPALNAEGFEEAPLSDYDRRFRPQSADSPFASGGER